jgi:site-specific DNA-methyltransferase (adenine-specific)
MKPYRTFRGDCIEGMRSLPDSSIDLILTDPPYGTTACKWDTIIPLEEMWAELKRVIKPNGAIVMTASQPFTTTLIASNLPMFKYCWVWEKDKGSNFASSGKQPLRKTEDVVVFYSMQPFYDSQGEPLQKPYKHTLPISKSESSPGAGNHNLNPDGTRIYAEYTHKRKTNLLYFARDNANKGQHPTQKPVALMEYLIRTYTNEGETVLDFTMGSGTTGVACVNTNRKFIGIELDLGYYEIARQRLKEAVDAMEAVSCSG